MINNKSQDLDVLCAPTSKFNNNLVASDNNLVNYIYHDENLIIIQNRLLHAISRLNLNERRLILFLSIIVRLERIKDPNKNDFFIRASDFAKEYNLGTKSIYRTFAATAKSIQFKPFFYWSFDNNSYNEWGSAWFIDCGYLKEQGGIKVRLSDTVLEMFTVFNHLNPFTKYQREWIVRLGSYGIILLELAVCRLNELRSNQCTARFTVEYLREKFDCVNSYARFDDFRSRVIDKAIKDVHKHTPIFISYEKLGRGRKTREITFVFKNTHIYDKDGWSFERLSDKIMMSGLRNDDPFHNFKMTSKQLAVFGTKVAKKIDKNIGVVISEMSNVYLQDRYIEHLKLLDFVPSDWYTEDEIKKHPTPQQIAQEKLKAEQEAKEQAEQEQSRFKQDYETLLANAEEFVLANQKKIGFGIEKVYFNNGDYQGVVRLWERYLLNERDRKGFALLDEILSR